MDQVLIGHPLVDPQGNEIGKVTDVISNPATLEAEWLTVKTGLLGGEHLVPMALVDRDGDTLSVPCTKDQVKAAPKPGSHIAPTGQERDEAYAHYEISAPPADPLRA